MFHTTVDSPIGQLFLAGDEAGLKLVGFPSGSLARSPHPSWRADPTAFQEASRQLAQYFAGERRDFDLPLAPDGTPFQRDVLTALQAIPYGETRSYSEVARTIGRPKAVRAVGAAVGRNPLPILIACHRVIGSDGSLTGFGGGLAAKRHLLDLERHQAAAACRAAADGGRASDRVRLFHEVPVWQGRRRRTAASEERA